MIRRTQGWRRTPRPRLSERGHEKRKRRALWRAQRDLVRLGLEMWPVGFRAAMRLAGGELPLTLGGLVRLRKHGRTHVMVPDQAPARTACGLPAEKTMPPAFHRYGMCVSCAKIVDAVAMSNLYTRQKESDREAA